MTSCTRLLQNDLHNVWNKFNKELHILFALFNTLDTRLNSGLSIEASTYSRGWGWGLPYKNDRGAPGKLEKNPYDVPRSCFVGVAYIFHLYLRDTNSKTTHHLHWLSQFFQFNILKGTAKALTDDLFQPEHSNRNQNCFNI